MIHGKTILAIIPARGGSKGIPRKNICKIAGKPLIAWTIEEARKSRYIDRLILSSEDPEIISIAAGYGCEVPFTRPVELAQDDTPGIEPVLHALRMLPEKYDYVMLLQPTSPLRTSLDIDGCVEKLAQSGAPACVSVSRSEKNPFWMYILDRGGRMRCLLETNSVFALRQFLPEVYALNGAVYIAKTGWLTNKRTFISSQTVPYVMPPERSFDIDSELDLKICHLLLSDHRS